jgi:hypothetical protein
MENNQNNEQIDPIKIFEEIDKNPEILNTFSMDELEYVQNFLNEYKQYLKDKISKK